MIIGDPLEVKLSLDDSDMKRAERETSKSLGAIEGAMEKTATVVKTVFSAAAGALLTSGIREWLNGTERTFSSFGIAMQTAFTNGVNQVKAFGSAFANVFTNIGPQLVQLVARLATTRAAMTGAIVGTVALLAINSFHESVKSSIRSMDEMATSARNIGMATKDFSQLAFAAQSTGISVDTFKNSMSALSSNLAKDDAFSPTIRALQALGIESNDVTKSSLTNIEVLSKLADKFSQMEDGVNKTALATAVLGEKGGDWIPLLNRGSGAIDELRAKADQLNATLGVKAAQDAREYTESMAKFNTIIGLTSKEIGTAFLPVYKNAANALASFAEKMNIAAIVGGTLRAAIGSLYIAARPVVALFMGMGTALGGVVTALAKVLQGDFKSAAEIMGQAESSIREIFKSAGDDIVDTLKYINPSFGETAAKATGLGTAIEGVADSAKKMKAPALRSTEEIQRAMEKATATQREAFIELTKDTTIPLEEKIRQLKVMVDSGAIGWQAYYNAVRSAKEMQAQMNIELAKMNLDEVLGNNQLPATKKIQELEAAIRSGTITFGEFKEMMKSVNDQSRASMEDLASTTATALTTIFKDNKAAAIASAIINTSLAVTKALSAYAPPVSFAMAGLHAAMGFAQVQQIKNTQKGSTTMSSSAGTGASGAATAEASVPKEQTLTVQGLNKNGIFDGETVRNLAQKLIDYQKDGGRVVLA